jgi:hypothetical protein
MAPTAMLSDDVMKAAMVDSVSTGSFAEASMPLSPPRSNLQIQVSGPIVTNFFIPKETIAFMRMLWAPVFWPPLRVDVLEGLGRAHGDEFGFPEESARVARDDPAAIVDGELRFGATEGTLGGPYPPTEDVTTATYSGRMGRCVSRSGGDGVAGGGTV